MLIFLAMLTGLVLWIVLWAIGVKSFDAFMLTILITLLGAVAHICAPFLPGNRGEVEQPPPGS